MKTTFHLKSHSDGVKQTTNRFYALIYENNGQFGKVVIEAVEIKLQWWKRRLGRIICGLICNTPEEANYYADMIIAQMKWHQVKTCKK